MPSASRVNWARIRVTVLSVAALSILITLLWLLTGGTLLTEKSTLYIVIDDATGLSPGSPVRLNGIGIGKVSRIALTGSNSPGRVIRVSIAVEKDHLQEIPVDSYCQLSSESLVGDKYVDITRGRGTTPIQPGGEITFRDQPELLKTLDLEQFAKRLREVDALLSDIEQGNNRVGRFVLGEDLYDLLRNGLLDIDRQVRRIGSTTGELGTMLYTDQLYRRISQPVVQLDRDLADIQAGRGALGRLLRDDAQYEQLRNQLAGMRQSLASIRGNPFLQSDRMYADWNRMLVSLIQVVDDMNANPLLRTSEMYDSLNGAARELAKSVREFRQDPQKFLRIKLF